MKIVRFILACCLLSFFAVAPLFAADLGKGFNISDWLSTDEAVHIQTTRYTLADFEDIKSMGGDHVRIHINLNAGEVVAPDYALSPIHYKCLDNAVMWAEQLGMKVVIANSEGDIADGTADAIRERLVTTWRGIAAHFAGKGDVVAYEIFIEPGATISAETWNGVAAAIIAAIREADASHSIIVGPVNNYALDSLAGLSKFNDSNVIYAFNFFEPLTFTRQGDSYADVDYNTVLVPFPYAAGRMPAMDAGDAGGAAEAAYNSYATQGNIDWVKSRIDVAAAFSTANGVPMYCANFGVNIGDGGLKVNDDGWDVADADKSAWLGGVVGYFAEKGIAWSHAGFRGGFGIFYDYGSNPYGWMQNQAFPYDVNSATVTALGLTPPPTEVYSPEPLTEGFVLYDEEVNPIARWGQWWGDTSIHSLYNQDEKTVGQYSMSVFYPGQYCAGDFFFPLYLDMSLLAEDGYVLDLFILSFWETAHIQARFEDSNMDLEDKPWRMNYHIDTNVVPFDGSWQRVTIPLTSMEDQGAWDPDDQVWSGGPAGMFDWSQVQRFQFVSETEAQPDAEMFIDRVRVVSPTAVENDPVAPPRSLELMANYPNPFNPTTTIEFYLPVNVEVALNVYNVRGELVKSLLNERRAAGTHQVQWDGTDFANRQVGSGVYLYQLKIGDVEKTRRMLLMR